MKGNLLKKIAQFLKEHRFNKRWQKLVTVLAVIVVFCTTYMLILPAITMEGNVICGMQEHTHGEACYIQLITEKELICTDEHEHIDVCYEVLATEAKLDCGTDEHTHSEPCYDKEDITVYPDIFGVADETETTTDTAETSDTSDTSQTTESTETTVNGETTTDIAEETTTEATTETTTETTTEVTTETTTSTEETTTSVSDETEEIIIETNIENLKDENGITIAGIAGRPREEIDAYIAKVTEAFDALPTYEEIEEKIYEYEEKEDYDGEEDYITKIKKQALDAYQLYLNLDGYKEDITNSYKLFDIEWLWNTSILPTNGDVGITVHMVNSYTYTNPSHAVVAHGGSVVEQTNTSFPWWIALVVEMHADGYLYVSQINLNDNNVSKGNYEATTADGFVLLVHATDTTNYTNAKTIQIGDMVTSNFDYTVQNNSATGSAIGTLTFSEYVPPEPEVDIEEDITIVPDEPSDSQVIDAGGKVTSADKNVVVTKTIDGTELENVFDITLTVQTKTNVQTFLSEPDMAVVIVMDISNTMNSIFTDDTMSRYDAAVTAASNFIKQFAENTSGLSQIGFVAFNTHAHEIFALQPCATEAKATTLINEMSADTDAIISASGYGSSRTRFTNVEGGLKRGYDMLASSGNANQYIILLTDGFPTTYLVDNSDGSTNYNGYEPYTSSGTIGADGVFYDSVLKTYCKYGTSYSDKASIKAREMATKIKNSGAKVFSVGVDVAGQTVQEHINSSSSSNSIVDRTGTTYEIGGANDLNAYKNWLGNSVGSGYYYDSTDQDEITNAFNSIFEEIRQLNAQSKKTVWTATDPLPVLDENMETVEFIHFFDINGNAQDELNGEFAVGAEDTAYHEDDVIHWDLKKSGYTTSADENDPNTTYYYYSVTYRVRLQNELTPFVENDIYETNGDAYLEYRTIVTTDGVQEISETKTVYFPKPSVKGYLAELNFLKQNYQGESLENATFTLTHDVEKCAVCRGDKTAVTTVGVVQEDSSVLPYTATSDSDGKVAFTNIPSGHTYYLTETVPPIGYVVTKSTFSVVVAYDKITVTETLPDGTQKTWTGDGTDVVSNYTGYVLPATGGTGVTYYYIFGGAFVALSLFVLFRQTKRKKANATP